MSLRVRHPMLALTGAMLLAGCGADNPPGTLGTDDLPSSVKVSKVTHDWAAGQVECQDVNDAEDDHIFYISPSFDDDKRAAVSYTLKGAGHEYLGNSVWRLFNPTAALDQVSKGLDACVRDYPANYQRIQVNGHSDAVAYTAQGEYSNPEFTRRILLAVGKRVVIVSITRSGNDHFSVTPEDLLEKAVKASADAPK